MRLLLGGITAVKYQQRDSQTRYWAGLTLIFFYLSLDEGAVIHELFSDPLQTAYNTSGYLTFAWLLVFVPLLFLFVLLYLRFLFHLPARIRNLFILAGLFYVGGAVVVEAISANRYDLDGGVTFHLSGNCHCGRVAGNVGGGTVDLCAFVVCSDWRG